MCDGPEVTVIIPAYNAARHIQRSIRSLISQSYTNWQLIVVDDGSTDNTVEIASKISDPRIRIVSQENKGVSAARNKGVKLASTDWVAFLDADDEWLPHFLETTIKASMAFPEAKVIFTNFVDGVSKRPKLTSLPNGISIIDDYFDFWLRNGTGMCSSAVMVRRDALQSVGGFPEGVTHGEDTDTWARLAWTAKIICVPQVLAVYHTDTPGSAMKIPKSKRVKYPKVLVTYREWRESGRIPSHLQRSTARFIASITFSHIMDLIELGRIMEARNVFRELNRGALKIWRRILLRSLLLIPGQGGRYVWQGLKRVRRLVG